MEKDGKQRISKEIHKEAQEQKESKSVKCHKDKDCTCWICTGIDWNKASSEKE